MLNFGLHKMLKSNFTIFYLGLFFLASTFTMPHYYEQSKGRILENYDLQDWALKDNYDNNDGAEIAEKTDAYYEPGKVAK